jgi:7-cyano-7-deazaguanine synthase in queuosine biosynthesis
MNAKQNEAPDFPQVRVAVLEKGQRPPSQWTPCSIGENLDFSTERLESYFLSSWQPVIFDALLVAAAVEFCDRIKKRPPLGWGRDIELQIPVHDPAHWSSKVVYESLTDALNFLTGDRWRIIFTSRRKPEKPPLQSYLQIPPGVTAVIPFSDGMDSRAVAGLEARKLGTQLVRVRLGSKIADRRSASAAKEPFTSVPYRVITGKSSGETSARSRGFKFATVSGVAAYLVGAPEIVVPESGQGALGSALVPVGHAYEDYRNHPLFTDRMEKYLGALFGHTTKFRFPRLWNTKGETLSAFAHEINDASPVDAWSCWQQSRQVSVDGHKRQCGICAACMLRRLSVYWSGLGEHPKTYVWENLGASTFESGASAKFNKVTRALKEYAIAGTLHLDHLAGLCGSALHAPSVRRAAAQLAHSQNLAQPDAEQKLNRLLNQHALEWKSFVRSLGPQSFVGKWVSSIS